MALSKALAGEHVNVTRLAEDSPSNVNAAGQADVLVSMQPDPNACQRVWLWAAADNFRIAATTAVECAENMAATRPKGKDSVRAIGAGAGSLITLLRAADASLFFATAAVSHRRAAVSTSRKTFRRLPFRRLLTGRRPIKIEQRLTARWSAKWSPAPTTTS